ncbi:MAG: ABC transporter permease [Planctomycetota bacterium]
MRKIIVVAVREYQAAVKTKAFIFSLLMMPLIWGGSIVVQLAMRNKVDIKDKRIAVVDYSGKLFDSLADAARKRNETDIFESEGDARKQTKPRFLFEKVEPTSDDPTQMGLALSDRVRKNVPGDIMAFVIIGPNVLEPAADPARAAVNYYSNSPTYDDIQKWLFEPINARIRELRLRDANLDSAIVAMATARTRVTNLGLVSLDESGQIKKAEETNQLANIFVPMGLMMLMLMVIMLGASPLVQSVLEEKTLRIAEVLLGSIPPFQLMMGKLVGMVGVSLTIATVYMVGAFMAIRQAGFGPYFPAHVVWWFALYLALAVLLYGSMFIAVGAAVSDMKESQNLITPVMLVAVAPMFVWMNVVREPSSTMALTLSLIPTATPMLMIVRQAVPPGIPLWQPLLGVLLVLLTTTFCVFAAGRIFRVGILMQGKGAKVGEMMRWVFRG